MLIEDDEIAILARVTMSLGDGCQKAIDDNIAKAQRAHQWDEMSKWHRVRARVARMQLQMTREDAVDFGNARPTPGGAGS
jgi:hypothetical protein